MDSCESISEPETEENKILYICTKCQLPMEIIIIDEKNNKIHFNCINNNEHNEKKSIKEYIEFIDKNSKNKNCNITKNDKCCSNYGYNKFEYFCVDCKKHICKNCLEKREHINHIKNNILEVKPRKEEISIIKDIIKFYEAEEQKSQKNLDFLIQIKEENSKNELQKNGKIIEDEKIKIVKENIEKLMNIKTLLELIFQAYDKDKNNYYYAKNILTILESTRNKNINVSQDIIQRIEKKYNHIIKINQRNKKIDELNSLIEIKMKENNEIIKENELKINNYENKIKADEIEINKLNNNIKNLKNENEKAKNKYANHLSKIMGEKDMLKCQLNKNDKIIKEKDYKIKKMKKEIEIKKNAINDLENENKQGKEMLNSIENKKFKLELDNNKMKQKIEENEKKIKELINIKKQYDNKNKELLDIKKQYDNKNKEFLDIKEQYDNKNKEFIDIKEQYDNKNKEFIDIKEQYEIIENKNKELINIIEQYYNKNKELNDKINELNNIKEKIENKNKKLIDKINELNNTKEKIENKNKKLNDKIEELNNIKEKIENKNKKLQDKIIDYKNKNNELNNIIINKHKEKPIDEINNNEENANKINQSNNFLYLKTETSEGEFKNNDGFRRSMHNFRTDKKKQKNKFFFNTVRAFNNHFEKKMEKVENPSDKCFNVNSRNGTPVKIRVSDSLKGINNINHNKELSDVKIMHSLNNDRMNNDNFLTNCNNSFNINKKVHKAKSTSNMYEMLKINNIRKQQIRNNYLFHDNSPFSNKSFS